MSQPTGVWLRAETLTQAAFAPFGQVIECAEGHSFAINAGTSQRFSDLARLETDPAGRLALSIFRAEKRPSPFSLTTMERHPLGSQAFMPLREQPFLIAVTAEAPDESRPATDQLKVFRSNGRQGVNFARGVWHHPLIALSDGDFLVVDRLGPGENCDEIDIAHWRVSIAP